MIHVIEIENPFDKRKRKDFYEEYKGKPVKDLIKTEGPKVYSINGAPVIEDTIAKDGDQIVIMPRIEKKTLGIVLTIGITVLSAGIAGGAAWAFGANTWLLGWRIGASLALTFLGNYVSSKLTPKPKIDISNTEQSNTYGWNGMQTLTSQGSVLPVVYGTVKTAGIMLQRHIVEDGKNQYLSILYCLAEGPIDDISNIKLNGNPISNYSGVQVDTRNGQASQSIISNFNDSYAETSLAYELNVEDGWRTYQLEGNIANGLQVHVAFPGGLYYTNNDGNPDWTSVTIELQYRKVGDADWISVPIRNENADWKPTLTGRKKRLIFMINAGGDIWKAAYNQECRYISGYETYTYTRRGRTHTRYVYDDDGDRIPIYAYTMTYDAWKAKEDREHNYAGVIKAKETAAFYRMYTIDGLTASQYEVRMRCSHKDRTDTRTSNKIQWEGVSQIIYDDFTYPGKAILGLKALATDQLSGSDPSMTCLITRDWIYAWNPDSKAYEKKPANNPAWAAYDILHHCVKYGNTYEVEGVPKECMDYYAFEAWANQCDANGLEFNYLYDSAMQTLEALQYPARVGRGSIIMIGTKYSCVYDYAASPSQLFTMANIKKGTFKEEYQDVGDRANALEISFMNKDKDYERDVLTVYGEGYDTQDTSTQPTQIELMGCTSAEQAYKYGKFYLRENKYEIRTVTFDAWTDSIACMVGDVILLQHDITDWGDGGRVKAVDPDSRTITLDKEIDVNSDKIIIRDQKTDVLHEIAVYSVTGKQVNVSSTDGVEAGAVYAAGKTGREAKKFKITSISKNDNEMTREITAVEYYDEIYSADLDDVPEIVRYDTIVEPPKNLTMTNESYKNASGEKICLVHVSWRNPRDISTIVLEVYNEETHFDDKEEFRGGENTYTFTGISGKTYGAIIYARNEVGMESERLEAKTYTNGGDNPPPDVQILNVEKLANNLRRYWWKFDYPTPNDIAGFRMKYTQGREINWNSGILVQEGLITQQPFETQTVRQGIHAVMIKAVDNAGNESRNFAYCLYDFGDMLAENVLVEEDLKDNGWSAINKPFNNCEIKDGSIYPLSAQAHWAKNLYEWNRGQPHWRGNWKQYSIKARIPATATGQLWLESDISGPAAIYYRKDFDRPKWMKNNRKQFHWIDKTKNHWNLEPDLWKQYSEKTSVKKSDIIEIRVDALNNAVQQTIINGLKMIIDVPDKEEHFENLSIPAEGLEVPIVAKNYRTTAVRADTITGNSGILIVGMKCLSREPCVVQLFDSTGKAAAGEADITWQGYQEDRI